MGEFIPPCNEKTETFFPEDGDIMKKTREAKALCAICPLVASCLEVALKEPQQFGIWGGATANERYAIKRRPHLKEVHLKNLLEGLPNGFGSKTKKTI